MQSLIDTELLTEKIAEFIECGFTPQVAVYYAVLTIPALCEAVIEAIGRIGENDKTRLRQASRDCPE